MSFRLFFGHIYKFISLCCRYMRAHTQWTDNMVIGYVYMHIMGLSFLFEMTMCVFH